MQLFYLEKPLKEIILNAEEARHVTKVLRKKEGDEIELTDGKGFAYKSVIKKYDKKKCLLTIISSKKKKKQHNYKLHVAISPTKNIDRFNWFLEKSTEIGIDEITPIICKYSERKIIKHERANKVLIAALKQSLRFHLPKLNKLITLEEFFKKPHAGEKLIAHCKEEKKELLKNIINKKNITILIGPEGDFSENEISMAIKNKFKSVSLGVNRLRTETAGVVAVNTINIIS